MKNFLLLAIAISLFTSSRSHCGGTHQSTTYTSPPGGTHQPTTYTSPPAQSRVSEAAGQQTVDDALDWLESTGWIDSNTKLFLRRIAIVESRFGNDQNTYRPNYNGGIWQVDEIGFNDTQATASHSGLARRIANVNNRLRINWNSVTWSDLRMPLHSAIAARLFLSNIAAPIPTNLQGQAEYWKRHYNRNGSGTVQDFIDRVNDNENSSG